MATLKYGIPEIDPNHELNDGPVDINASLAAIDNTFAGFSAGLLAARPVSTGGSPGVAGRLYRATDTGQVFQDTGTGWVQIPGYAAGVLSGRPAAGTPGLTYRATDTGQVFQDTGTSWAELARVPVADTALASPNNSVWRSVKSDACKANHLDIPAANTYVFTPGGALGAINGNGGVPEIWMPQAADVAVAGKTTKLRLEFVLGVNSTAPAANFTLGLHQILTITGGSQSMTLTLAAAAVSCSINAPVAQDAQRAVSASIDLTALEANRLFVLAVATSGGMASGSFIAATGTVQMRHL